VDRSVHQCRFFLAEIIAGVAAGSAALQADALDFFGDAANYAISLGVAGMALTWRARAALAKGGTLIAFAVWVLGSTVWHAMHGTLPHAEVMGVIGFAALIANGGVAHRHRLAGRHRRRDHGRPRPLGWLANYASGPG
jgi:Co/Zn/Cd efflux system component